MIHLNLPLNTKNINNFTSYISYRQNNKCYVQKVKVIRRNWFLIDVKKLSSCHQVSKQVYRYFEMKDYMLRLQANKKEV